MYVKRLTPNDHLSTEKMINAARQSYRKEISDYAGREHVIISSCLKNAHNTVLEQSGDIQYEIETSIDITREFNRHRPLSIVEMSTRYVEITEDEINDWSALEMSPIFLQHIHDKGVYTEVSGAIDVILSAYRKCIESGMPRQYARKILPLCTKTRLTVTGNLWDYIKFIRSRMTKAAHPDIRLIAQMIFADLNMVYPDIITVENMEYTKKIELEPPALSKS